MDKIKLTLECGYEVTYADDVMDDMEVFDLLVEMTSATGIKQEKLMQSIFETAVGAEEIAGLKQFLFERDGKVKRTEYSKAASEFAKAISAAKKK